MHATFRPAVFFVLTSIPVAALAQGPKLTWKALDAKKPFYVEMTTKTTQVVTVNDTKNEQRQEQTFWFRWTPYGKKKGNYEVVQKILGVNLVVSVGGTRIPICTFDGDPRPSPMRKVLDSLVGMESTLIIDPGSMAVEEVRQPELLVKKLTTAFPKMAAIYKHVLSERNTRQNAAQIFGFWPSSGIIPKSKRWTSSSDLDMGAIGKYMTKYHYRYLGRMGRLHHIEFKCDMSYVPPKDPTGLPFIIREANLKSKDCRGDILFDADKGRLAEMTSTMRFEGETKAENANNTTRITFAQTQTTVIRMTDRNPIIGRKRSK